jgi:hypothetical protein
VFSSDRCSAMDRGKLTNFVTAISVEMMKAKESHQHFTLRDLRRTLETLMAGWGVSSDARKHLQSHGWAVCNNDTTISMSICVKSGQPWEPSPRGWIGCSREMVPESRIEGGLRTRDRPRLRRKLGLAGCRSKASGCSTIYGRDRLSSPLADHRRYPEEISGAPLLPTASGGPTSPFRIASRRPASSPPC